jgi:heme-degrading monooxygenase HmoA
MDNPCYSDYPMAAVIKELVTMRKPAVVSVSAFEIPRGENESFLARWERVHEFLLDQPGYLSSQLHKSSQAGPDFRYLDVAFWSSEEAFRAATSGPEFLDVSVEYPFDSSVYQVVSADQRWTPPVH